MNLQVVPKLKWRYGYFLVVNDNFADCAVLYSRFNGRNLL